MLVLICVRIAMGDTPPMQFGDVTVPPLLQGMIFWAITLSYSPFLLLFLNRAVRAIGPALLAMMLVATTASVLALVAVETPAGFSMAGKLMAALNVPPSLFVPLVMLLGMLAAAPLAWWTGRLLRAAYAAKWVTDQSLMIDAIWLFQAGVLSLGLIQDLGPAGWVGLAAFGVHKAVTLAGMWPAARAARRRAPVRLLLLRVFGRQRSTERLFDLLGTRWRYAGPIHMIGAPDLASSTIDPDEFLDFLAGRLRQRFILEPADLPERVAALDERCDFDARWRVSELYCGNDTWRDAVRALMARSDAGGDGPARLRPREAGLRVRAAGAARPGARAARGAAGGQEHEDRLPARHGCRPASPACPAVPPMPSRPGRITLLDIGERRARRRGAPAEHGRGALSDCAMPSGFAHPSRCPRGPSGRPAAAPSAGSGRSRGGCGSPRVRVARRGSVAPSARASRASSALRIRRPPGRRRTSARRRVAFQPRGWACPRRNPRRRRR